MGNSAQWLRAGTWLLGSFLGSYALYVVGATAFLSLGGLEWATRGEPDARVLVASGYSLSPGRVHLKGLTVRVQDYNIRMEILADEVDAELALWKLPFKKIHVRWTHARGVEYRLIHRVHDAQANANRLAAFPRISGASPPHVYAGPPAPRGLGKPWSVQIDAIVAEVRLAWLLEYQLRGKLRATGSFSVDPSSVASVGPCAVDLLGADVHVGRLLVARRVQGRLFAQIGPFDPTGAPFSEVLSRSLAKAERVSAELTTLRFTELYGSATPFSWDGRAVLHADLTMNSGQLGAGSFVRVDLKPVTFRAQALGATGTGNIWLKAAPGGDLEVQGQFSFPHESRAFSARLLEGHANLVHRDLLTLQLRAARLTARSFHVASPAFLQAATGDRMSALSSATIDWDAACKFPERGEPQCEATLASKSSNFYLSGVRLGVSGTGTLHCVGTRASALCALDAHVPYLLVNQGPRAHAAALWLRLASKGGLQVSREKQTFAGNFELVGSNPKPVVAELLGAGWLPKLGLKFVPSGSLSGTFRAVRTSTQLSLEHLAVAIGPSRLEGHLVARAQTYGAWTLAMPVMRLGIRLTPAGVTVHPFVGRDWLSR